MGDIAAIAALVTSMCKSVGFQPVAIRPANPTEAASSSRSAPASEVSEAQAAKSKRFRSTGNHTPFRSQTAGLSICERSNGGASGLESIPPTSQVVTGKGKAHMYQESDEDDPEPDDNRRELSTPGTVTDTLVEYGYPPAKVAKAIKLCTCGAVKLEDFHSLLDILDTVSDADLDQALQNKGAAEDNVPSKFDQLLEMGYDSAKCRRAVDTYGNASICELCDFLDALGEEHNDDEELDLELFSRNARSSSDSDDEYGEEVKDVYKQKKRKSGKLKIAQVVKNRRLVLPGNEDVIQRNRTGFGVPGNTVINRLLPLDVARPPYFFFENVENMPVGEWDLIRRHLFNIEPEIMDALNFSVCRRPRGYIHNLPLEGRELVLDKPPMTIQELMGSAAQHWPASDKRVKLNTIFTKSATDFVRRQITGPVEACARRGYPTDDEKKTIMELARRWNLVWGKPDEMIPLGPDEVERCLGFDVGHTKILYSLVDKMKVLGNSFQVNTVAYQLSVLRSRYPQGMKVLSLFSGIGGAEVALHKLGIFLKVVVSIEIDDKARSVLQSWWKSTEQKGYLVHEYTDVRELDRQTLMGLLHKYQGFDLVIGGSPCNNLSGNNRASRVGLQGTESILFFEFPRILNVVREYMGNRCEASATRFNSKI